MSSTGREQARFDTRLPKEQKLLFEKAAELGGYRSLTEFIIQAGQEKAMEIITKQELILASERDCEIFFNELAHPKHPNDTMLKVAERYKIMFEDGQ